jgi:hypothetical protein
MANRKLLFSLGICIVVVICEFLVFWLIGILGITYAGDEPFVSPALQVQMFFLLGVIVADIPIFALIFHYTLKREKANQAASQSTEVL